MTNKIVIVNFILNSFSPWNNNITLFVEIQRNINYFYSEQSFSIVLSVRRL